MHTPQGLSSCEKPRQKEDGKTRDVSYKKEEKERKKEREPPWLDLQSCAKEKEPFGHAQGSFPWNLKHRTPGPSMDGALCLSYRGQPSRVPCLACICPLSAAHRAHSTRSDAPTPLILGMLPRRTHKDVCRGSRTLSKKGERAKILSHVRVAEQGVHAVDRCEHGDICWLGHDENKRIREPPAPGPLWSC